MATKNTVQIEFDGDSRKLKAAAADSEQTVNRMAHSHGRAMTDMKSHAGHAITGMTDLERSIMSVQMRVMNLTMAAGLISAPFALSAGVSIKYLSQIETAGLGIASSYMTGGKYIDAVTGKVLTGQQALAAAQDDSADAVSRLQYANIQTIATLDQIIRAYQEALPVAQARGFNRGQVEQFTTAMIQAAGAIDASGELMHMLGEETRSLLTGAIEPRNSRIAMALGIRPEDVKAHMASADELFSFLMGKLSAYTTAGAESQKTLAGLISNTKDIALQAGGQAFQPLFEAVKYELTEITHSLVTIDDKTKRINWNPEFLSGVESVKSGVNSIVAEVYRFSMLLDLAGGSMTAFGSRTLKVAEIVTRFMTIGQFGDSLKNGSESLAQWNKLYEERYKAADKALQDLSNREAGVGEVAKKVNAAYQQNAPGPSDEERKRRAKQAKADAKLIHDAEKEAALEYAEEQLEIIRLTEETKRQHALAYADEQLENIRIVADAEKEASLEYADGVLADIRLVEDAKREEAQQAAEFALERISLEEATQGKIAELRSANLVAIHLAAGDEQAALEVQYASKFALLDEEYQKKIGHARQIGMDVLAVEEEYGQLREQLERERAQRMADIWWGGAQTYINYAQQMATMGIQLALFDESQRGQIGKRMLAGSIRFLSQGLQAFMFNKAKEHVLAAASAAGQTTTQVVQHTASLAMLETEAAAWLAFYAAQTLNPFGGQAFIPAAAAMSAVVGGAIPSAMAATAAEGASSVSAELGMAALWAAGGIAVGSLGEAGASVIEGDTSNTGSSTSSAATSSGSSTSSSVATSSGTTESKASQIINIHVYGNVVDHDQFARELVPAINKALSDGF